MNRPTFLGSTASAALLIAAGTVGADAQSSQATSDENLRVARATVAGLIAQLQTEKADYGGHRAKAIQNYEAALDQINAALAYRHADTPNQQLSDAVLRHTEERTQVLITAMQNDKADYAGHRVTAINDLQAAVTELNAALATR
jgi:hypothetical protein